MSNQAVDAAASGDQQIRALMAAVNQAAVQGQFQRAESLFRQAQQAAPSHPLVLTHIARHHLDRGDRAGAIELLRKAAADRRADAEVWFNLGSALHAEGRLAAALEALERCLALAPRNLLAILEKGALQEALGQPRAAAMTYRGVLQMLPPGYRPPPGLEPGLQRARRAVESNNRDLERFVDVRLSDVRKRHGNASLARFDKCVDIVLQKRAIYHQQPGFMFFPELPAIEFYAREQFPELTELEAASTDIRKELLDVLADGPQALDPYLTAPEDAPREHWGELANSRRWSAYYFWKNGSAYEEHMRRCPRTVDALRRWPLWDIPGNGPTAMFSILQPRTRIPAHTGTVNTRLVVHLPLVVPAACGFRVGGQLREWIPGEGFVFDDSIDHEAWNDSDQPRAVLIFTIWSPHLSEGERELVKELTDCIGDFYGVGEHCEARRASG